MKILALKIKLKHLAAEARIIKHQERKMGGHNWGPKAAFFREHRINNVRPECRATHIAYGYLRGRTYKQIEGFKEGGYSGGRVRKNTYPQGMWQRVIDMVRKYGNVWSEDKVRASLSDWRKGLIEVKEVA
jgi:hypothetical protein